MKATDHLVRSTWSLLILLLACGDTSDENRPRDVIARPAPSMVVPAGAMPFHVSGTTHNNQPIRATAPDFSEELCGRLRATQPPGSLGDPRARLTSDADLGGTYIGVATMHAEACTFAPPPTVVAFLTVTAMDGDALHLVIHATRTPDSPPPPDNEASGGGTITGGTGRFEGATGEFNLSARSHGTVLAGTNVASQRDIDLNGYIYLPAGEER